MTVLTIVAVFLLTAIGALHIYWAFGGTAGLERAIPTRNGEPLIRPGRVLTLLVGIALIGFGVVACLLRFATEVTVALLFLGWLVAALFLLRAVGEFNLLGFFKKLKTTGFAEYDTKYYAPISLFLGLIFAVLAYLRT